MKHKLLSILTVLALCLSLLPVTALAAEGDQSWDCGANGNNVTATLAGDTLTIKGSGDMANYNSIADEPWKDSKGSIRNVVIEEGVTSIGTYAFCWCSSVETVSIASSVKSIGKCAFNYCKALTEVVIPEGVTAIKDYTFSDCHKLSEVTIPSTVTTIGDNAFSFCTALQSVELPDGLTTLGTSAFYSTGLKEVKIPNGVTSIGRMAFYSCANLATVEIPSSVETIGKNALGGTTNAEIHYEGTTAEWNELIGSTDIGAQPGKLHTSDSDHTVTIENGGEGAEGAGLYSEGAAVTVSAGTKDGKVFAGWTASVDLGEDFDATQAETSFTMPGEAVTLTAAWEEVCPHPSVQSVTASDPDENGVVTVTGTCTKCCQEVTLGTLTMVNDGQTITFGQAAQPFSVQASEGLTIVSYSWNSGTSTSTQYQPSVSTSGELKCPCAVTFKTPDNQEATANPEFTLTVRQLDITNAALTVELVPDTSFSVPYNGQEQAPDVAKVLIDGKEFKYTLFGITLVDASGSEAAKQTNAGTYKIKLTGKDPLTGTQTLTSPLFVIERAEPAIAWAADAAETLAYTGRAAELKTKPTVTLAGSGEYEGEEITYSYTKEGETATQNGLPMNAGTYYIKAAVPEQNNYAAAVTANTLTLTIKKVTTTVTAPVATRPTYNGTAQALVTAATTNAGPGAVQYALSKDGPWSTAIPTATDVGEYTVWYRVDETDNYTGVEAASVKAEIGKAQVTDISQSLMVRNGLEKTYTLDLGTFLPGLPEGQTYEELTYVLAETDIVDEAYIDSRTITLDGSVLTVPVKAVNKTGEDLVTIIKVTIKSENFQDIRLTISVTATNQTPLTITGVTAQGWTYDGKVHPGYTGTPRAEGYTGEFQVYYLGYLANGKNRKDAGTFQVEFVPVDSGYAGLLDLTFTVEQAQVTVKAEDKTAYVGDAKPKLTYQVSGLAEGESLKTNPAPACDADMDTAGTYPITISGGAVPDGGNYKAKIVYQNGALTVAAKPAPPTIPGGNTGRPGGNSGGSSGSGFGANAPSQTSSLPVNTTGQNSAAQTTTTTAAPSASTVGGTASAEVDSAMGAEIVRQAVANNSQTVVIAPGVTGSVTRTEVSIPAGTVGQIGARTGASLTVSTPVAAVTVPNGGLGSLSALGGAVVVSAEKTGNAVTLSVTAGGRTVERIPGGITLTVPAQTTPGTVAVLVRADGAREVVRRSVADGGRVTVPLEGSARLELVDNSKKFSDVPAGGWMADAVAFASARELLNGNGAGRFDPELPMSRGMLAVVLHNLENNPEVPYTGVFPDVDGGKWYAGGVVWAAERGIVSGYSDGTFGPEDGITREQLAVMLWRYAGSPAPVLEQLPFSDADRASGYALDALRWAVEGGILIGNGGQLHPQGTATRVQAAQMLKNFLEK